MHYERAPIREAVIGLQMDPGSVTLDEIRAFADAIASDYPLREDTINVNVAVSPGSTNFAASGAQNGFKCSSKKDPHIIQARNDYFIFSRLAPYQSWEPFRNEAKRLFVIFSEFAPNAAVVMIGTRYVNVLSVPLNVQLSEYVDVYPEIHSRNVPVQNMFMRLETPISDVPRGVLILQEAFVPPVKPETIGLVLDIDVRAAALAGQDLWEQLDALRPIKNRVFEESVTARAKEDFNASNSL